MKRLGEALGRLQRQWMVGAAVALILGASSAVFGALAYGLASILGSFLQWEASALTWWWIASGLVWLPLAIGVVFPSLRRIDDSAEQPPARTSIYG